MKKRLLSLLLVLCLTLSLLPVLPVGAEGSYTDVPYAVEGGYIYFDKASCTITECDSSVTRADIPEQIDGVAVTTIGYRAFFECDSLTAVTIPNSVTTIEDLAFYGCASLTAVTVPESVTTIDENPFYGCDNLKSIEVSGKNPNYSSKDGVLFDKAQTILYQYPGGKAGAYTIPGSVTTIGGYAFAYCTSLTTVLIPDSVTTIGYMAFQRCSGLITVTIGDSVTTIGDHAFSDCYSLIGAYFRGDAPELGYDVFIIRYDMNNPNLTIYYIEGKSGWTTPTWNGYPTATWDGVTIPDPCENGHTWGDWTGSKAATCTAPGEEIRVCTVCGEEETREVKALGHDWDEGEVTTPPTETENGVRTYTCRRCKETKTEQIPKLEYTHTWSDWTVSKAATCTAAGEEIRTCSGCGQKEIREVAALGHDYQNGVCTRCGEKDPNAGGQTPDDPTPDDPTPDDPKPDDPTPDNPTPDDPKPDDPSTPTFTDVPANAWFAGAVDYAVKNGLMNGMGNNEFQPNTSMTRGMLVTVLWRYAESPKQGENTFTDVPAGKYYTEVHLSTNIRHGK